jgi:hypothetical protein
LHLCSQRIYHRSDREESSNASQCKKLELGQRKTA